MSVITDSTVFSETPEEVGMADLRMFVGILKLADSAAQELGLRNLTPTDKTVLLSLWEVMEKSGHQNKQFKITFDDFVEIYAQDDFKISKAQFYKSLNRLIETNYLERIGTVRSAVYAFKQDTAQNFSE